MGISFKVSKIGKRFRANPPNPPSSPPSVEKPRLFGGVPSKIPPSTQVVGGQTVGDVTSISIPSVTDTQLISPEYEVSFALNLLPDGFYIGKPDEMTKIQAPFFDVAKQLLPYNRTSKTLFSAIESGWLPGDILDDIPCKYYNGALMCEVRDYRKCLAEEGTHGSMQGLPTVKKVILRMSLENIVNDIPTISDDSWTYSDLMEVESRILKFLQPKLHLDPSPMLDRLCSNSNLNNLNIVISGQKRKRVHPAEFTSAPSNQTLGKKVCNDTIPEDTNNESGDLRAISGEAAMHNHHLSAITQHASSKVQPLRVGQEGTIPPLSPSSQPQFQTSVGYPRVNQDRFSMGSTIYPAMNAQAPLAQNIMNSYPDTVTNNKRDNHDMVTNKRKHTLVGKEANQHLGLRLEGSTGADIWKNAVLSQQMDTKGVQYSTSATEAGSSFYRNQQVMKIGIKKEQTETEKLDRQESEKIKNVLQMPEAEGNSLDRQQWRPQQLNQQPFMKAHFQSQKQWQNNVGSPVDKDVRKDDILHKKKQVPSPRISSIPPIQSPISGDISTGALNGQFGAAAVAPSSSFGTQKDKTSTFSNAPLGAASVTTGTSDSFQRQPQSKRKTNSMPKTHTISGVASPASVSNIGTPLNVSSPSAVATSMTDSAILEGFTSIVRITKRYKLDVKKKKPEKFNKRPRTYSTKEISIALDNQMTSEDVKSDICPMSRSLIDGTMNNCKTRILTYGPANNSQGIPSRIPQRVVMNEMPKVGTVMMLQSDAESNIPSQDCMFTLPNTHYADLFGTQLRKLVENEGNQIFGDQTTLHMNHTSGNPSFFAAPSSDSVMPEGQQPEGVSGRQSNQALVNITNNDVSHLSSSQILPNSMSMLSPGNSHVLPISQGYLPNGANMTMSMRPQKMEQTLIQQQQSQQQQMQQHQMQLQLQQQSQHQSQLQQQAQLQRSSSILQMNPPISHLIGQSSSMQLGGSHMVNKQNQLQHQVLQQQQAHQFPRKGLMGLGAMSMGNSKMGLGGFNNVMGMQGLSSPIAPGLGNIAPNQMNLGSVTNFGVNLRPMAAHANAIARLRMAQNRGLYTGQPGMASLSGNNNHMLQSSMGMSMLDQTLRPNMSPMQRNAMTSMGPPKIPGDIYMNQQQLQKIQQQQQQQLQLQQQISSPLQQSHVSTPSMMVSSPASTMQQQPIIPQPSQQIAMSPQQLSGGTLQQINNGNSTGPGPSSPQLSSHSQTHGSVGSPLDQLQGANKGGSVNTG